MGWQPRLGQCVLVLSVVPFFTACASSLSRKADGLRAVDDLVSRIERVYVDAELSRERIAEALIGLQTLTDPNFAGDAVQAFADFTARIELAESQAEDLERSADLMQKDAKPVFAHWEKSLAEYTSPGLRARSQARLNSTRERYDAIVQALGPARAEFASFNAELRDHATYLGLDFNRSALSELEGDVAALETKAQNLDDALAGCMTTSLAYVQESGLPGEADASGVPPSAQSGG